MSDKERPTLREQLDSLSEQFTELRTAINSKPVAAEAPKQVPEALAIAACIRTLDPVDEATRSSRNTYSYEPSRNLNGSVGRVLRYLAEKYGVNLVEQVPIPCGRTHVDQVDFSQVHDAIERAVQR